MKDGLPECIVQGEAARLFPVLSTTSKEGRTTSIFLACMTKIDEFGEALLQSVGQRVGKRAQLDTYTEVVCKNLTTGCKDRPDGLIALQVGSREWKALVEAKVGNVELEAEQVEKYRALAKDNGIDCVITLSNQFATTPATHPLEAVRKSRSKIPAFHWSWMHVLTTAELLFSNGEIDDHDQLILLNELRRFLTHESAGVKGFDRMPKEWADLNRLVASGGIIPARSPDAQAVLEAWHQETRDLSLILSRMTETMVSEKLPRKHLNDPALRQKDELQLLRERTQLGSILSVPNAAAPIEVCANITRRSIDVGMTLRAPEDRKSTKARLNWLLRQIKVERADDIHIRFNWPGASEATQYPLAELRENADVCENGKSHLTVSSFHVFLSKKTGARFSQQTNFIVDLEAFVPEFYGTVGANLSEWKKPAPKIKTEKPTAEDVSTEGMSEDAESFNQ